MAQVKQSHKQISQQQRIMFRLKSILLILVSFTIFLPCEGYTKWSLTPRFYVEERYDDNLFLTESNKESDFITTIAPGINFLYETPTAEINLDYELQRFFYDKYSELDFTGHRLRTTARKDFGPRFSAGIREFFLVSEDPIQLTGIPIFERPSIRTGMRNKYTMNVVEPDMTFRFGENRSIRVGYRNHILRNNADSVADLDENAINALLTFRFNIHNGIEIFYEHINQKYGSTIPPEPPKDFDGDEIRGKYIYFFDPKISASFEYRYHQINFDHETTGFVDYRIHDMRIGFSLHLYETTYLSASAGLAFRDADGADDESTFASQIKLSNQYKGLNTEIYGETGFGEDFLSAENLGINEFWRVGVNGRYQLLERLWANGFFFFERDRFLDLDRTDKIWSARGGLSYQVLKWLFLSIDYEYNKRDSDAPFESYTDNRYFGRITVKYDIAEYFQQ
jgi:hypothetical protein